MAQPNQDDEGVVGNETPLSFLSLPDIAHASIASFLPDRNKVKEGRLRLSEVSRALCEPYGGTAWPYLRYVEYSSVACLVALLRRQQFLHQITVKLVALLRRNEKSLATLVLNDQETIATLCFAIAQGCCRGLKVCVLSMKKVALTRERLNILAGALETNGALAGLTELHINCTLMPGGLPMLTRALGRGTSRLLDRISFHCDGVTGSDMESIADTRSHSGL